MTSVATTCTAMPRRGPCAPSSRARRSVSSRATGTTSSCEAECEAITSNVVESHGPPSTWWTTPPASTPTVVAPAADARISRAKSDRLRSHGLPFHAPSTTTATSPSPALAMPNRPDTPRSRPPTALAAPVTTTVSRSSAGHLRRGDRASRPVPIPAAGHQAAMLESPGAKWTAEMQRPKIAAKAAVVATGPGW